MKRMMAVAVLALAAVPAGANAPRSVAISYFDINAQSADFEPLRKGLADMLITDLAAVKSLQIVERAKLNQVLDELKLSKSPFIDPAAAQKLGKGLSADFLMTGGLTVLQGTMRIDARLVKVETGKVAASQNVSGKQDEFFALEKELVELLVKTLDPPLELAEKSKLRKSQTESFPAFAAYSRGLEATDRGEADKARAQYAAALEADPQYQAAKAALDRLKVSIGAHETKQAGDFRSAIAALDPAAAGFGKAAKRLYDSGGGKGTYVDRFRRKIEFLGFIADKGWKPWEEHRPRTPIEQPGKKYLEAHELLGMVGSWGGDLEVIEQAPLVLEYLLTKYPDDATLAERMEHDAKRTAQLLASGKARPGSNYGEAGERAAEVHALFKKLGAKHAASLRKADAVPAVAMARVLKVLETQHQKGDSAFDGEITARIRALDPASAKYSDEVGDLIFAVENHPVRARRLARKIELLEEVFSRNGRPARGSPSSPVFMELDQLLMLMNRFDADPDTVALLPPVGEYLLAKYPDHPTIASQLKLTAGRIAETMKDPSAAKRWKGREHDDERAVEGQARALFKKVGAKAAKK